MTDLGLTHIKYRDASIETSLYFVFNTIRSLEDHRIGLIVYNDRFGFIAKKQRK